MSVSCDLPVTRVYRPYWEWEDHAAGLYDPASNLNAEASAAQQLLADPARLEPAMRAAVAAWPKSAEHQLTNPEQNRRAWVGQSACRHAVGAAALATRAAWSHLTDAERAAANCCADQIIAEWVEAHTTTPPLFTLGRGPGRG